MKFKDPYSTKNLIHSLLMFNHKRKFTAEEICNRIFTSYSHDDKRNIYTQIGRMRKKGYPIKFETCDNTNIRQYYYDVEDPLHETILDKV